MHFRASTFMISYLHHYSAIVQIKHHNQEIADVTVPSNGDVWDEFSEQP